MRRHGWLLCCLMIVATVASGSDRGPDISSDVPPPTAALAATSTAPAPAVMTWSGYVLIGVVCCMFVALLLAVAPMFAIQASASLFLYLAGIVNGEELFSGLTNNGVLSIAMLFIVVHPIVKLPALKILCRAVGMAPSQVLMAMSASILLGNWALLGASSNVIISEEMEALDLGAMSVFELARVNLLLTVPVLLYCVFMPPILLPQRRGGATFYAAMKVQSWSPYAGAKVSKLLASFLQHRKDDVDRVVVLRESGRRLNEPFSRLATLEEGDELIVCGLVDTLLHCCDVESGSASSSSTVEMSTGLLDGDSLDNGASVAVDTLVGRSSSWNVEGSSLNYPPLPRTTATSRGHVEASFKNLIETLFFGELPRHFDGPSAEAITLDWFNSARSAQSSGLKGSAPPALDQRPEPLTTFGGATTCRLTEDEAAEFIGMFEGAHGVSLATLRFSTDGLDMLDDKLAYALAPSASSALRRPGPITADGVGQPVPPLEALDNCHESQHGEEGHVPHALLYDHDADGTTLAEKHRALGGRIFSFRVPMWFPLGVVELPEGATKKEEIPCSPRTAKASRSQVKVLQLPWFYEYLSLLIFLCIIITSVLNVPLSISSFVGCVCCVILRLVTCTELARSLPVEIYLLVGFSFPLGIGVKNTNLAQVLQVLISDWGISGFPLLLLIGAVALVLTNMITTQGAAQVLVRVVVEVYQGQGKDPLPGIICLATLLCCAVCTPFAIPTNAVVIGPGGYRAKDFVKFGLPLSIMMWVLTAVFVAWVYDAW